jgi:hypothetical protein
LLCHFKNKTKHANCLDCGPFGQKRIFGAPLGHVKKTAAEKSGSNRCAGTSRKIVVPPIFLAAEPLKMLPKCAMHFSKHH